MNRRPLAVCGLLICFASLTIAATSGHTMRDHPDTTHPGAATHDTIIGVERTIDAPIDAVWRAWTTNEGARAWLSDHTNIELRLGGPFEVLFVMENPEGQRGSEGCTILSYLPQEMLSFTWNAPPQFGHARDRHTWVVLQLEAVESDRTLVKLAHLGWDENIARWPEHEDEWLAVRAYFDNAWPRVLGALERRFADES